MIPSTLPSSLHSHPLSQLSRNVGHLAVCGQRDGLDEVVWRSVAIENRKTGLFRPAEARDLGRPTAGSNNVFGDSEALHAMA